MQSCLNVQHLSVRKQSKSILILECNKSMLFIQYICMIALRSVISFTFKYFHKKFWYRFYICFTIFIHYLRISEFSHFHSHQKILQKPHKNVSFTLVIFTLSQHQIFIKVLWFDILFYQWCECDDGNVHTTNILI